MRKKLTFKQKFSAVIKVLLDAKSPMSATAIAKEIGFKSKAPIMVVIEDILDRGILQEQHEVVMNMEYITYYLSDYNENDFALDMEYFSHND